MSSILQKINKPINSVEYYQNLYEDIEKSDFTKLMNESKLQFNNNQNAKEINKEIEKSTQIHCKGIKGFNYNNYTRLNNYEGIRNDLPNLSYKDKAPRLNMMAND